MSAGSPSDCSPTSKPRTSKDEVIRLLRMLGGTRNEPNIFDDAADMLVGLSPEPSLQQRVATLEREAEDRSQYVSHLELQLASRDCRAGLSAELERLAVEPKGATGVQAAIGRLAAAMGNPAVNWNVHEASIESATIDEATRRLSQPPGECPDSCCHWDAWKREKARADALQARLAEPPSAARWIPVTERVPEPEVYVLCWDGKATFVDWFGSKPDAGRGVTHWLPYERPPGAVSDMHDGRRALTKSALYTNSVESDGLNTSAVETSVCQCNHVPRRAIDGNRCLRCGLPLSDRGSTT